jgi:ketosteroid isomerase-like protein
MPMDKVEIARRAFDGFNRRDLDSAAAVLHPDAVWIPYLAALEEASYRGVDQIVAMWKDVIKEVPEIRLELIEVIADKPDQLVTEVEFRGAGRASGADIRTTLFQVVSFRDGMVSRVEGFRDRREALQAVATGARRE